MSPPAPLPIDPLLPRILGSLRQRPTLVIVAPPGAGKTTRVPPALLDSGLVDAGEIVVLEPRRVAARAAARRLASERGVALGGEVGYRVRLERRAGPETRITFVTEGVLTRRLQADPLLEGVAAVVLDELHERSLEADLALAMLREVQREVRPELILVCMSATLEAGPLATYLGDCPVLCAEGRAHPVDVRHLDRPDDRPLATQVAGAVARALAEEVDDGGHVLVFLPGAAEIRRAAEALAPLAGRHGLRVLPLHGEMPAEAQDEALAPSATRKVILATNVAESSLTIDGVTTVVDAGLAKQLRHDPRHGLDRLVLGPVSRASAEQRAGRAGRTAPGRALRLWTAGDHHGRAERELPEVRRVDLAGAVLQVRAWGAADPARFEWFEAPPPAALERADRLLSLLGAVDAGGVTDRGRSLLALPLHPRLGRMLIAAHGRGRLREGALLAALCAERDVLRSGRAFADRGARPDAVGTSDLLHRLELLEEAGRAPDAVLERFDLDPGAVRHVRAVARQLERLAGGVLGRPRSGADAGEQALVEVLLAGFVDRVAARRRPGGSRLVLAGGRAAELDGRSVVREGTLLVAHRVDDGAPGRAARVRLATQITPAQLRAAVPGALVEETALELDPSSGRVVAEQRLRYGELVLERRPGTVTDREAAGALLAEVVARDPRGALAVDAEVEQWIARVRFLSRELPELDLPPFDEQTLTEVAVGLCAGLISLDELRRQPLLDTLRARLGHERLGLLEREAPERLTVPSGSRVRLEYPADGPPVLAVRLQEMFGLLETPRVARSRVPVLLHLLAPNQRPVQVTQDLASFWDNGYPDVRRELAGRYPKHPWPADPRAAAPTRRTRGNRRKRGR